MIIRNSIKLALFAITTTLLVSCKPFQRVSCSGPNIPADSHYIVGGTYRQAINPDGTTPPKISNFEGFVGSCAFQCNDTIKQYKPSTNSCVFKDLSILNLPIVSDLVDISPHNQTVQFNPLDGSSSPVYSNGELSLSGAGRGEIFVPSLVLNGSDFTIDMTFVLNFAHTRDTLFSYGPIRVDIANTGSSSFGMSYEIYYNGAIILADAIGYFKPNSKNRFVFIKNGTTISAWYQSDYIAYKQIAATWMPSIPAVLPAGSELRFSPIAGGRHMEGSIDNIKVLDNTLN